MILEAILAVLGTVGAAYVWERQIRDRISVRRVSGTGDEDTGGIIELYASLFPDDGRNYSAEELIEFTAVGLPDRHVRAEDIVLAARYHGDVVGFVFCHFYPERKKAIVSYFGIDRQVVEARRSAAKKLLRKLAQILSDRQHACDFLFFDLLSPDSSASPAENAERKARPVLFKQSARALDLKAYRFHVQYECPRISLADGTHEHPLILMCVPLAARLERPVSKQDFLGFLRFIYLDCYGDLYPVNDERFTAFHEYLRSKLTQYEKSLPDQIQVS